MPQRGDQGVGSLITSPAAQPSVRSEDICTDCDAWELKAKVGADCRCGGAGPAGNYE